MEKPDLEELKRCLGTLQSLAADPGLAALTPESIRVPLMEAAGRVALPGKVDRLRRKNARRRELKDRREVQDRAARATTAIREARLAPVYAAPVQVATEEAMAVGTLELSQPRYCYVCKAAFTRLHFFYDSMCPSCARFNYEKRFQTTSLEGRTALITGARLKIGYQAALKLLRAGAQVVATTRFPQDAAARYAREPDFNIWRERLQVHGLDLRHSPSVEIFTRYLDRSLGRLDFLINNAAQTVRRPPGFYAHLLEGEAKPASELSPEIAALLVSHENCKAALTPPGADSKGRKEEAKAALLLGSSPRRSDAADATGLTVWHAGGPGVGIRESARLSQIKYSYEDSECGLDVFPPQATDADLQQVDLRTQNSWRMTLAEVPTAEMLELQLINSVAPFILCARLKPLMLRQRTGDKHIVNVSAMEGIFSRGTKTDKHPHTNMAKAALNMLTLTSARDYVKDGIHMNAVDTGWVTDEDPAQHASRKKTELDFQPPLDIVDGAARVCDPVFSGILSGEHHWGKFLKDYKPAAW